MKLRIKKFTAAVTLAVFSIQANAGAFDDALSSFKNNSTTNRAGVYSGPGGSTASFGGFTVIAPQSGGRVTLFSVTPPKVKSVGCMGIDGFLGGFDFINGEEIKKLFENITAIAPGFIIHLVLKKICAPCEEIVADMEDLAQFAISLNANSCNVAKRLADSITAEKRKPADRLTPFTSALAALTTAGKEASDTIKGECVENKGESNSSFMREIGSVCNSAVEAFKSVMGDMLKDIQKEPSAGGKKALQIDQYMKTCQLGQCNMTWTVVRSLQQKGDVIRTLDSYDEETKKAMIAERLLFLNLIGTTIPRLPALPSTATEAPPTATTPPDNTAVAAEKEEGTPAPAPSETPVAEEAPAATAIPGTTVAAESVGAKVTYVRPAIKIDDFYDLMMCGANPDQFRKATKLPTGLIEKTESGADKMVTESIRLGKSIKVYCKSFYLKAGAEGAREAASTPGLDGSSTNPESDTIKNIVQNISSKEVDSQTLSEAVNFAENFLSSLKLWTCRGNEWNECKQIDQKPIRLIPELKDAVSEGYIMQVYSLMYQAVLAIRNNQPIPNESLALLQSVPFPLYQLINLSAVYPAYALDTMDSIAGFLADSIVRAKLQGILDSYQANASKSFIDPQYVTAMLTAMSSFQDTITERSTRMSSNMAMQEALIKSLNTLQASLQREVIAQDLLGNTQYAGSRSRLSSLPKVEAPTSSTDSGTPNSSSDTAPISADSSAIAIERN